MTDREQEQYLYKILNKTQEYLGVTITEEEKWELIMMELINI